MASVTALHDVCAAIAANLSTRYRLLAVKPVEDCLFKVVGSSQFTTATPTFLEGSKVTLSLFLYRLTINEHGRQASQLPSRVLPRPPLAMDLHLLMTAWASSPLEEQTILAWSMQQLHERPLLDMGSLAATGWQADESVQILPTDLSMEDMMRLWDALEPKYHLSVAYVGRVVRVDSSRPDPLPKPVLATRFGWMERPSSSADAQEDG
jgi:hypothetical protein